MKKIIHYKSDTRGHLHCDNPECGHDLEDNLPFNLSLVGYPCPKCGANMLTLEDFLASEKMFQTVEWINKWFGWLGKEEAPEDAQFFSVRNHAGKLIVER